MIANILSTEKLLTPPNQNILSTVSCLLHGLALQLSKSLRAALGQTKSSPKSLIALNYLTFLDLKGPTSSGPLLLGPAVKGEKGASKAFLFSGCFIAAASGGPPLFCSLIDGGEREREMRKITKDFPDMMPGFPKCNH